MLGAALLLLLPWQAAPAPNTPVRAAFEPAPGPYVLMFEPGMDQLRPRPEPVLDDLAEVAREAATQDMVIPMTLCAQDGVPASGGSNEARLRVIEAELTKRGVQHLQRGSDAVYRARHFTQYPVYPKVTIMLWIG